MQGAGVRIERIVSTGQASPPGFWYDQPDDEFVVLLAGAAALRFEEATAASILSPATGSRISGPCPPSGRVDRGRPADRLAGGSRVTGTR